MKKQDPIRDIILLIREQDKDVCSMPKLQV